MMRAVSMIFLVLGVATMISGCERGTRDLERWTAEVRQRPPEGIPPIPPIRTPAVVIYEAQDLRDPFRSGRAEEEEEEAVAATAGEDGPRPDFQRRREYLESYPLDTLSMVGTLEMEEVYWALIKDNEGIVHRVREGNFLGQNHGQIARVSPDRVSVVELVPDGAGGYLERDATIALTER